MSGRKAIKRERIDRLMLKRGMVESREQAQDLISQGMVSAGGRRILKSSTQIDADADVKLSGERSPYAGRGGLKLEAALRVFGIEPQGWVAVDVGSSTGGFTDCLLQKGVRRVYAIDVGYGQMAWHLRQDPRVVILERTNVRYLDPHVIDQAADLVTIDVSFISLRMVLHKVIEIMKPAGFILALVKPQFEVGKGEVGRGGIVKDPAKQEKVVREIIAEADRLGLASRGTMPSPIPGRKGNVEFFVLFQSLSAGVDRGEGNEQA